MYGNVLTPSINTCRYQLFCSRNQQSHHLPPCQDALNQHTKRANYQAAIWRLYLDPLAAVPNPNGYGWKVTDNDVHIDWMLLPPAPDALLVLIICGCTGLCSSRTCSCFRNDLPCTDACLCNDHCENQSTTCSANDLEDYDQDDTE